MYHCVDDNVCLPRNTGLLEEAFKKCGAKHFEVRWLQLPPGQNHDAHILVYESLDQELFCWLLKQRREDSTASACEDAAGSAAAEDAPSVEVAKEVDAGGDRAVEPKYFVCGSWTGWAFQELQVQQDGTLRCIAGVEANCAAAFQIVQNQDWNHRYHPRLVTPNMEPPPGGAEVCLFGDVEHPAVPGVADGPGPEGHDINWLIKAVGANARFTVIFDPRAPAVRWMPYYDEQDRASIRRLSALGLNPAAAVRAYAIAGRNEGLATEMAGTFLFEGSDPLSFALSS